ncbi:hypothetical protein GYMLUDRAFT_408513 [Collybiopsis luxurians FD-317 M1]|uniref:Peptidase C14 caspase domain-containing protein n=1 Tax=Collybiopsis luxurians FD-317 M1 TaxID=944289 RepID=A0A0D0C8K1_9AGAR|nr:hypothetical protein GYMLUDRAFT_408513 [Collybiopsis luxurians FD-317 M1]
MTSAIHAILVGINDYEDAAFSPLKHSVDDARKIKNLLLQDLGADEGSIRVLENSDATKDGIMEALQSISTRAERNDAIVFFFSGYAALSDENDSEQQVGFLCPYDAQSSGGLSDKSLLRTFELLSKQCGNNITVFLDTSGDALKWENPPSCVVIYPNQASEDDHGGLFTSAITEVLQIQCSKFDSIALTVEAFAERVESIIQATKGDEVVVRCTGWNIDRPLFNSEGDQGHYALIPGYTQKDGGIILKAGAAHNVKSGSIYRIFKRNIMLEDGFGELPGQKLRADVVKGFTAELSFINETATKLPPFFYAVEDPSIDAKIASAESNVLNGIYKPTPESKEEEADLTLVEAEGKIRYIWKGLDNDIKITDRKDLGLQRKTNCELTMKRSNTNLKKPTLSQWASKRITVLVKYGINEDSEENNSREGDNDEPPYTEGEEDGQEQEGGNGNEE